MKYLLLTILLVGLSNVVFAHDHGGEIANECLNKGMIEADYISDTQGIVHCYVEGMEMMAPRYAATKNGTCTLTQLAGKKVSMKYDFIDTDSNAESIRRDGSAFDEAYQCFREALR